MDAVTIAVMIAALASQDGVARERARKALVADGRREIIPALIDELSDTRRQVRWESAMALCSIANPDSAMSLVQAMDDRDPDVAWVAAEGVAKLGTAGLFAILNRLAHYSSTKSFCQTANHALKLLRKNSKYREELNYVIQALDEPEPTLAAPVAAFEMLQKLRNSIVASQA